MGADWLGDWVLFREFKLRLISAPTSWLLPVLWSVLPNVWKPYIILQQYTWAPFACLKLGWIQTPTIIQYPFFYFQSIAGVVISLLVASTLVSATQCMKALYHGGLELRNESCTICVKVARYNPPKNHHNMPENANDKAFSLPAIQQTGNRTKNVRKVFI